MKKDLDLKAFEDMASSYNVIRSTKQSIIFKTKDFAKLIAFTKLSHNFTKLWEKYGIAIKVTKGKYMFPSEPVLWSKFKYAYEEMRNAQREYNNNYNAKHKRNKKETKESKETDIKELLSTWNISLDDIAKYLISTGNYRIEKREITWNQL